MIKITENISINEKKIHEEFIRSSGPGGQNVNKVATAVMLRFNIHSSGLPKDIKERLAVLSGKRVTSDGVLIITARKFRTQERNRQDALERLIDLVKRACEKPVKRKKTKPSAASKERRLKAKSIKSSRKRDRNPLMSHDGQQ